MTDPPNNNTAATTNNGQNNNNNNRLRSDALRRDVSLAQSTIDVGDSAINLLDYYLVHVLNVDGINEIDPELLDDDMESFLTGYSYWLRNTNIPQNHKKFVENPELVPETFLVYTTLREYLSKAILLMKKLFPDNEFLKDEDAVGDISGAKFAKACKRAQSKKDQTFGQESKVGLYRRARYGHTAAQCLPHWTFLVNCDEICKQMLLKTLADDDSQRMTEKRLHLALTKHGAGRGGEAMELDWPNFHYNPWLDTIDGLWKETKTLSSSMLSFVPNKDGYETDVLHSLGSFFVVGKGLFRPASSNGKKMSTKVIPYLSEGMKPTAVSRFLTRAVRQNLHPKVPPEQQKSISAVSLRIASITEMAAGNVGIQASHARSGHVIDSNQKHYMDNDNESVSIAAAKCLAGWEDHYAPVYMPNLSCLEVPMEVINKLIDKLVAISLPDFKENGRLRPILLASIASLIMYDQDVIRDLKTIDNAISLALRKAFKDTNTIDPRALSNDPVATLMLWGQIIKKNFHDSNPDFQPLTDSSNSLQVINGINHIAKMYSSVLQQNNEMRGQLTSMAASLEREREETRQERRENAMLRQNMASLTKHVSKLLSIYNPQFLPPSPSRGASDLAIMPPVNTSPAATAPPAAAPSVAATAPPAAAPSAAATAPPATAPSAAATAPPATAPSAAAPVTASASGRKRAATAPPAAATSAAAPVAASSNKRPTIAANYNGNDADQQHGGTTIISIIKQAHGDGRFAQGVVFTEAHITRPARFTDKAKYGHCLDLITAVVTEEQKQRLMNPGLTVTEVLEVSHEISEACLDRICQLEGKQRSNNMKNGYTGVGLRAQKLKDKFPSLTYQLPGGQQRLAFAPPP